MKTAVKYLTNKASETEITDHLSNCESNFIPPLSCRVKIDDYAKKITNNAMRFEAWSGNNLVGLVAAYCNDEENITYITNVSVLPKWTGKTIAHKLMNQCIEYSKMQEIQQIVLEVANDNPAAIKLYQKNGFVADVVGSSLLRMYLIL
jgi:ribosomal protein S18 acetylase RimI-like enzyme